MARWLRRAGNPGAAMPWRGLTLEQRLSDIVNAPTGSGRLAHSLRRTHYGCRAAHSLRRTHYGCKAEAFAPVEHAHTNLWGIPQRWHLPPSTGQMLRPYDRRAPQHTGAVSDRRAPQHGRVGQPTDECAGAVRWRPGFFSVAGAFYRTTNGSTTSEYPATERTLKRVRWASRAVMCCVFGSTVV